MVQANALTIIRAVMESTPQPALARSPSSDPAGRPGVGRASPSPAESEARGPAMVTDVWAARTASQLELDLDMALVNVLGESLASAGPQD